MMLMDVKSSRGWRGEGSQKLKAKAKEKVVGSGVGMCKWLMVAKCTLNVLARHENQQNSGNHNHSCVTSSLVNGVD